jgi:hypothetical protein
VARCAADHDFEDIVTAGVRDLDSVDLEEDCHGRSGHAAVVTHEATPTAVISRKPARSRVSWSV